ncbi:MAG TPA: ABATE domain-containing protein [Longimicrobiales bacterium]
MTRPCPTLTYAAGRPFRYIGGEPCLDLVNTGNWTVAGLAEDRLSDYARVVEWAQGAGVVTTGEAAALRRAAAARPREAEAAWEAARRIRGVLRRVFTAVARAEPPGDALDEFNRLLRRTLARLELVSAGDGPADTGALRWAWRGAGEELEFPLWPVIRSAADLLASGDSRRIGVCAGPDCGWLFVDRSRNGLRRWCDMRLCGTREKSRRRRSRPGRRAG